jgi:hypothetical protein
VGGIERGHRRAGRQLAVEDADVFSHVSRR